MNDRDKIKMFCENRVSMTHFLRVIAGINNSKINNKSMTHDEVKKLLPNLKRTNFDSIINDPKRLYTGEIILVEDSKGQIIPYENPHVVIAKKDYFFSKKKPVDTKKKTKQIPDIELIDLSELTVDELVDLYRTYTFAHLNSACNKVRKELESRPNSKISIRKEREKVLRKERKYKNRNLDD